MGRTRSEGYPSLAAGGDAAPPTPPPTLSVCRARSWSCQPAIYYLLKTKKLQVAAVFVLARVGRVAAAPESGGARAAVVGTALDSQSQGERGHLSALHVCALTLTCCPATADGDPSEQQQL